MAHILRIRYFLLEQWYKVAETTTVVQDNKSAILLEDNSSLSSNKRTKHLNVRFFVKENIDDNEITIAWCPTDKLVGPFFTKPLRMEKNT